MTMLRERWRVQIKSADEAADLIERRLVKTTGFYGRVPRDDYQRGIAFALEEVLRLLRGTAVLALVMLSGCAGPFGISGSPEQLKELIKIKDAAATFVVGMYAGMTVRAVGASIDKGLYGGTIVMDENCKTTITTAPWVPGQPVPPPTPKP